MRVLNEAVTALARALVFATMLLDPALIVIGGGLSLAGDRLLDPLRPQLADALAWRRTPPLVDRSVRRPRPARSGRRCWACARPG